jgi:FkbM family methyltransferase
VYSFDGNLALATYALQRMIPAHQPALSGRWKYYWMAVSNHTGMAKFLLQRDNNEASSLTEHHSVAAVASSTTGPVPVTTLDRFWFDATSTPKGLVDMIKIDSEGYDFFVIQGSRALLAHQAKVVLFEYGIGTIGSPLKVVVDLLADHGFACYFAGESALVAISGGSWRDEFDFFASDSWLPISGRLGTNVLCASKRHAPHLLDILDSHALPIESSQTLQRESVTALADAAARRYLRVEPFHNRTLCKHALKPPLPEDQVRAAIHTWRRGTTYNAFTPSTRLDVTPARDPGGRRLYCAVFDDDALRCNSSFSRFAWGVPPTPCVHRGGKCRRGPGVAETNGAVAVYSRRIK